MDIRLSIFSLMFSIYGIATIIFELWALHSGFKTPLTIPNLILGIIIALIPLIYYLLGRYSVPDM